LVHGPLAFVLGASFSGAFRRFRGEALFMWHSGQSGEYCAPKASKIRDRSQAKPSAPFKMGAYH